MSKNNDITPTIDRDVRTWHDSIFPRTTDYALIILLLSRIPQVRKYKYKYTNR